MTLIRSDSYQKWYLIQHWTLHQSSLSTQAKYVKDEIRHQDSGALEHATLATVQRQGHKGTRHPIVKQVGASCRNDVFFHPMGLHYRAFSLPWEAEGACYVLLSFIVEATCWCDVQLSRLFFSVFWPSDWPSLEDRKQGLPTPQLSLHNSAPTASSITNLESLQTHTQNPSICKTSLI